jgi:hypothetical protein
MEASWSVGSWVKLLISSTKAISRSLSLLPLHAKASEKEGKRKRYKNTVHYRFESTRNAPFWKKYSRINPSNSSDQSLCDTDGTMPLIIKHEFLFTAYVLASDQCQQIVDQ